MKTHWQPAKLDPPKVDPELEHLDCVQRSAEVISYSLLSFEWWLSPNGTLREWLKLSGKISSLLLIPAVLIMPVVSLILWQFAKWMAWLAGIVSYLVLIPLVLLVAIGATIVLIRVIKLLAKK